MFYSDQPFLQWRSNVYALMFICSVLLKLQTLWTWQAGCGHAFLPPLINQVSFNTLRLRERELIDRLLMQFTIWSLTLHILFRFLNIFISKPIHEACTRYWFQALFIGSCCCAVLKRKVIHYFYTYRNIYWIVISTQSIPFVFLVLSFFFLFLLYVGKYYSMQRSTSVKISVCLFFLCHLQPQCFLCWNRWVRLIWGAFSPSFSLKKLFFFKNMKSFCEISMNRIEAL